jgi:hypothetical protein
MHDLAIMTLASGARGGHRLVLAALIVVIVILAVGWAVHAARLRSGRGGRGKQP